MIFGYDIGDIAAIFGLVGSAFGAAWLALRSRLGMDFAGKKDLGELDQRVGKVEQRLSSLPTHADLAQINNRLIAVESAVQVQTVEQRASRELMGAELQGVRDMMNRVDIRVGMLFRHELDKERAAESRARDGD
jgi:Protein of unknown function (DUF2730)